MPRRSAAAIAAPRDVPAEVTAVPAADVGPGMQALIAEPLNPTETSSGPPGRTGAAPPKSRPRLSVGRKEG